MIDATIINGSLLTSGARHIAHQTNCVTQTAARLAKDVFECFPHADVYKDRVIYDEPGTIQVMGNGESERFVINMYAQFYPGRPRYADGAKDGYYARRKYFFSCLKEISALQDLEQIAFPWGIGCGAAGGEWAFYHALLDKFAEHMKYRAEILIYRI